MSKNCCHNQEFFSVLWAKPCSKCDGLQCYRRLYYGFGLFIRFLCDNLASEICHLSKSLRFCKWLFRTNSLTAKISRIHTGLDKKEIKGIVPFFFLSPLIFNNLSIPHPLYRYESFGNPGCLDTHRAGKVGYGRINFYQHPRYGLSFNGFKTSPLQPNCAGLALVVFSIPAQLSWAVCVFAACFDA